MADIDADTVIDAMQIAHKVLRNNVDNLNNQRNQMISVLALAKQHIVDIVADKDDKDKEASNIVLAKIDSILSQFNIKLSNGKDEETDK